MAKSFHSQWWWENKLAMTFQRPRLNNSRAFTPFTKMTISKETQESEPPAARESWVWHLLAAPDELWEDKCQVRAAWQCQSATGAAWSPGLVLLPEQVVWLPSHGEMWLCYPAQDMNKSNVGFICHRHTSVSALWKCSLMLSVLGPGNTIPSHEQGRPWWAKYIPTKMQDTCLCESLFSKVPKNGYLEWKASQEHGKGEKRERNREW